VRGKRAVFLSAGIAVVLVPTMVFMNGEVPEVFVGSDGVLKALEILKQS
jgi:hypothetical protein